MSGTISRSTFLASLRPATWRGLDFKVQGSEGTAGRRVHVHEYPFKEDGPWSEDLGRASRRIVVKGYLIGDDVAEKLRAFEEAAEQKDSGTLVHPLRGDLDMTLLSCTSSETWDEGRIVRLGLEFVEAGERRFPSSATDTRSAVGDGAGDLDQAAGEAGERGILATLKEGYGAVQRTVRTAQGYVRQATSLVSSATGAIRSVTGLASIPGLSGLNLGRFSFGSSGGLGSITRSFGVVTSLSGGVSSALSRFNTARNSVTRLGTQLMTLAGKL